MIRALALMLALAMPATAQVATSNGTGAVLRGLDKVSGRVRDLEVAVGQAVQLGRISIAVRECRYPRGNRSGDAFAYVIVREADEEGDVFAGWMIASSPALNAMDHSRYDVWVLRCTTS